MKRWRVTIPTFAWMQRRKPRRMSFKPVFRPSFGAGTPKYEAGTPRRSAT